MSKVTANLFQGNFVKTLWDRWNGMPGGKRILSELIGRIAPYSGSIHAQIVDLRSGYAELIMPDRKSNHNHLRSLHAVALANLAETTAGIALLYGLPEGTRGVVTNLTVDYFKKARGAITGKASWQIPTSSEKQECVIVCEMTDSSGEVVAKARVQYLVGPTP